MDPRITVDADGNVTVPAAVWREILMAVATACECHDAEGLHCEEDAPCHAESAALFDRLPRPDGWPEDDA